MSFLRDKNLPTYYFCLADLLWDAILRVVIVVENEETLLRTNFGVSSTQNDVCNCGRETRPKRHEGICTFG
jgi:hypothetical protein